MQRLHLSDIATNETKPGKWDNRGRWLRHRKRPSNKNLLRLDISHFAKAVDLTRSYRGSWRWTWSNGHEDSISYTVLPDQGVRLVYTNNKTENLDYLVKLVSTTPNYGGARWWWFCPNVHCGRRCRVLYAGRHFVCWKCAGGYYETQRTKSLVARIDNELAKLRRQLGPFYADRPKGMHWRVFERIQDRYFKLQECRDDACQIEIIQLARASGMAWPCGHNIEGMTQGLRLRLKQK